jgi:LmbE family N-acetylglucosaminyl deacetylase
MHSLDLNPTSVLCIGAHCDDVEIGAGGTVLQWISQRPGLRVHWVVLAAQGERATEAEKSAGRFLSGASASVELRHFREGFFPYLPELKEYFDDLAARVEPEVILTHTRGDLHQDHRTVAELTLNAFRDHLILEYEVPKYDGDLGRPNAFVELPVEVADRKVRAIIEGFPSQSSRPWFREQTFRAMMTLRGIECRAADGLAEAFFAHKLVMR